MSTATGTTARAIGRAPMHHLLVLNPNSTGRMTERVVQQVQAAAGAGFMVSGATAEGAPPVIDSRESFDAAAPAVLAIWQQHLANTTPDSVTGVMLACFGDPGLEALRVAAGARPVQGLAHAAMTATEGRRFAILTAGPAWEPILRERAGQFGFGAQLTGVYCLPIDGKQLADDPQSARPLLQHAAQAARNTGAERLILGGAAFAGLRAFIEWPLPAIDCIDAATLALMRDLHQADRRSRG